MKLKVIHHPPHPSPTAPATCSVSLPIPVASSLTTIRPFAALVILKLLPHTAGPPRPVFVAWAGATLDTPYTIGIPPAFADALQLPDGTLVLATVVERVVDNNPLRTVHSALIRPVAYDACTPAEPLPHASGNNYPASDEALSGDPYEKALQQYTVLSSTADALERTILTQLRVVFPGLEFPLRLPARDSIPVRLVNVTPQPEQQLPIESPYALLVPDSQIEVQPPPVRPTRESTPKPGTSLHAISAFYRFIPYSEREMPSISQELTLTHAVLHAPAAHLASSPEPRFALVSRKESSEKQLALPVALVLHPDVPRRHVSLPPHVWQQLQLSPLCPVLVDEVPPFSIGGNAVQVAKLQGRAVGLSASLSQLLDASGVYYDGMCLRDVQIHLNNAVSSSDTGPSVRQDVELWDREGLKEDDDHPTVIADKLLPNLDTSPAELLHRAKSKRVVKEGRRSFQTQTIRRTETKTSPSETFATNASSAPVGNKTSFVHRLEARANHQAPTSEALLSLLTVSQRNAFRVILGLARTLFHEKDAKKQNRTCRAVALEGPLGSGKTYVSRAVASFLSEKAQVRTIWIRGKVHVGERNYVSLKRIQRAFAASIDGGPGLVVLDDMDLLLGNRKGTQDKEENNSDANNIRGQEIAQLLEDQIGRYHSEPVLVLLTCGSANDLEQNLRRPGIIRHIVHLSLPTASERMFLFWSAIRDAGFVKSANSVLRYMKNSSHHICTLSEGYSPRDVHVSLKRTQIAIELSRLTGDDADESKFIPTLSKVLNSMTPSSRSGISFSERKGESLAWDKLGALSKAKHSLWEALQLPSNRPDIFIRAPIRLPHGILLYGPPGCGKTMLARIAAEESQMRCLMVKGPELLSKYIGESEAEVRRAFDKAAKSTPCVLLFDEFDSLAPRRGGEHTGVADRVVNTLLTCMDGAERLHEGVYIIATTSRPELIDPALLRPGRLDRWIPVDIPSTAEERFHILETISTKFFHSTLQTRTALHELAELTDGYTGADLGAILNDANLQRGKQDEEPRSKNNSASIPDLLKHAHQRSRPSLSRSQRAYFARTMNQFAPQDLEHQNGTIEANVQRTAQLFGKRVALR